MAESTVDTLVTRYVLDNQKYQRGALQVMQATGRMGASILRVTGLAGLLSGAIGAVGLVAFGREAVQTSADLDSLKRGLTAIVGSAEEAERQFKILKDLAKQPGLGLLEAIQGGTMLQAAGIPFEDTVAALKGFGNALALVGKGKFDLGRVTLALSQMAASGKVLGQDLRQLQQAIPQILQVMLKEFGTAIPEEIEAAGISSFEFIRRVSRAMGELPSASDSIKNKFENLGDAWKVIMGQVGDSINSILLPALDKVYRGLVNISEAGVLRDVLGGFEKLFSGKTLGDGLLTMIAAVLAALKLMPPAFKAILDWGQRAFKAVVHNAQALITILGAVFLGNAITKGVLALVEAFKKLRAAIVAAGLAQVFMETLITGGLNFAKVTAGILAGLAAVWAIQKVIDSQFKEISTNIEGMPTFEDFNREMETMLAHLQGAAGLLQGLPPLMRSVLGTIFPELTAQPQAGASPTKAPTQNVFASIERNTRQTAENTRPDVSRRILGGGGFFGDIGVTAVELARGPRRLGKRRGTGDPFRDIAEMLRDAVMDVVAQEGVSLSRSEGRV